MPKKSPKPLEKIILNFYEGDSETLRQFYPKLGYTVAIREIVHQHCKVLRERASREGVLANVGAEPDITDLLATILIVDESA